MAHPKVSVVIACYNLGRYLDEAVDSVLAQTLPDFEIIIVNDGSDDPETNRLLAGYRRPRTRVLTHLENRGLPAARNVGIAHARGEYLCALDADDKLHPDFLRRAAAILDEDPSIAFVSSWLETFGDEEWVWTQYRCDLPALLGECTVNGPSLVRRSAMLAVGGYDERMREGDEDWDLWITLVERGYRGTILPEVLFYYRRRPDSLSRTCMEGETHLRLVRYLVDKHRESYQRHLLEVLLSKDTGAVESAVAATEADLAGRLIPRVEARRRELARLRAKLEAAPPPSQVGLWLESAERALEAERRRAQALEAALEATRHEVRSLRESWSWRVTAPLRAAYGRLSRWRRGPTPRRSGSP
jgi:glycosyltransferase involved in cell wall biosynthesis